MSGNRVKLGQDLFVAPYQVAALERHRTTSEEGEPRSYTLVHLVGGQMIMSSKSPTELDRLLAEKEGLDNASFNAEAALDVEAEAPQDDEI